MANYTITTWDVATITKLRVVERRSLQHAFNAYARAVYAVLEAFGKLDTKAAHVCMAQVNKDRDLLPIGEQRAITVSNTGRSVVIRREA